MKYAAFSLLLAAGFSTTAEARDLRFGGKLLLTNGVTTVEGSSGGGLASWAVIAGNATEDGLGASSHFTLVEAPDYQLRTYGVAVGLFDRLELSYARQNFDTGETGALLGLGEGFTFDQDVFGAKLRVAGDAVYGRALPQIAVGIQHKRNDDGAIIAAVGGQKDSGTDYYLSATRLFLAQSLLVNATARLTKANQTGLLGFGGDANDDYSLQAEGSLAYLLSRRFVIGAEYRTKPDNLGFAEENDWWDVFAAFAVTKNLTLTAAYVDLGSIATFGGQDGLFLSAQASF